VNERATPIESSDPQQATLRSFLARHGLWPVEASERSPSDVATGTIERLHGGANNAVFRVDVPAGIFLLKQYFAQRDDDRDRFGAEVAFCRFAWDRGIRAGPKLLASCREQRLALFEFIAGRPVSPPEIDAVLIGQAVRFCRQLQDVQADPEAAALPAAAESCFSIQQHLACVERRIRRLQMIEPSSDLERDAMRFARGDLHRRWEETRDGTLRQCHAWGAAPEQELQIADRVLSPSDFGFHNALLDPEGNVRFLDFEYAGWDDPAKLVCDFFCQVDVPVSRSFLRGFAEAIAERLPNPPRIVQRIELLLPVYQVKWCCIVLNEFLPEARARRRFSAADVRPDRQPALQLQKAQTLLDEVNPIPLRSQAN
jgi:hypothetical protein